MTLMRKCLLEISDGSGDPRRSIRDLLRKARVSGLLELPNPVSVKDTNTLSTLMGCFKEIGFHELTSIRPFVRDISISVASLESSLKLLENMSRLGYIDELVTGRLLTETLKRYPLSDINLDDSLRILRILQTQRYRHGALIQSLVTRVLSEGNSDQKFKLVRILGELDSLTPQLISELDRPATHSQCIDLAWGLLLQEHKLSSVLDIPDLLSYCLGTLKSSNEMTPLLLSESAEYRLRVIRDAIYFLHRESVYERLDEPFKAFLSHLSSESQEKIFPKHTGIRIKSDLKDISDTLFSENVAHSVHGAVGSFVVDIVERDRKIVWEYDGRDRFYANGSEPVKASFHELKRRIIKGMGYKVISIPHWHWKKMNNKQLRKEYCRTSRYLALMDLRDLSQVRGNPQEFRISDNAPANVSAWQFHNENVYKKQRPKQAWAWNRPTTTLRIAI